MSHPPHHSGAHSPPLQPTHHHKLHLPLKGARQNLGADTNHNTSPTSAATNTTTTTNTSSVTNHLVASSGAHSQSLSAANLNLSHQNHSHQLSGSQSNHSNSSTPNSSGTSFLIKDILRYEGQKRKQRKARTAFSDHQLKELEASFEAKKYLTVQDRMELANKLKLSDTQVKTWYQNRRTKHKRQTAVGLELLNEAGHLLAYRSVLEQSGHWYLSSAYANPGAQLSVAAAILQAQAQVHAQAAAAGHLGAHNLTQQTLANVNQPNSNPLATPPDSHSPHSLGLMADGK